MSEPGRPYPGGVPPMVTRQESVEEIRQAAVGRAAHPPTRQESLEEIRQALQGRPEPPADDGTRPFRPFHRPPMAQLCVYDDGLDKGEWVRMRGERLVIGRTEGDVLIPHDPMMSSRHAEIVRWLDAGRFRWRLSDLRSTNGTFVRLNTFQLKHNQEILIGSHRFRFHAAPPLAEPPPAAGATPPGTRGWESVSVTDVMPALVELTAQGEGQRFLVSQPDVWIGRDATQCLVVIPDDPLVSPRHAHLHRDGKNRWHMTNANSLNGLWLRVDEVAIDTSCQFQLGEQRFLMKVL
jgi:pSer/pThr/pTyr-binding forkhead associated (FHA) protein